MDVTNPPRVCSARQFSDMMRCAPCALQWDTNDPEPPECPLTGKQAPENSGQVRSPEERESSWADEEADRRAVAGKPEYQFGRRQYAEMVSENRTCASCISYDPRPIQGEPSGTCTDMVATIGAHLRTSPGAVCRHHARNKTEQTLNRAALRALQTADERATTDPTVLDTPTTRD